MALITQSELRSFFPMMSVAAPESPMIGLGAGQALRRSLISPSLPGLDQHEEEHEEESHPP
eukprot:16429775-Heterocapsa_arctica.AAC.1